MASLTDAHKSRETNSRNTAEWVENKVKHLRLYVDGFKSDFNQDLHNDSSIRAATLEKLDFLFAEELYNGTANYHQELSCLCKVRKPLYFQICRSSRAVSSILIV